MADTPRLPEERVREIAGGEFVTDLEGVAEVAALAREVLELREAAGRTLKGKPDCKACGGAGWYMWTAGGETVSEACLCRPDGEGAKDG